MADSSQPRTEYPNKDNALGKILGVPELANEIIRHLMPSARDVAALAATCKDATILVSANMEIWDPTKGNFALERFQDHKDEKTGEIRENKGVRQTVLCIAASDVQHMKTLSPYFDEWTVMGKFSEYLFYLLSGMWLVDQELT